MSIRPLPKELKDKAQIELNEVASRVQDDLKHVRDWLAKQIHVKARTDDQTLIAFLRNAKFSLERTKDKLEAFYTMKTMSIEVLKERNPNLPEIQVILKKRIFAVSWDPSQPLLPVLIIVQWKNVDYEGHSLSDMMKVRLMILDILINEYDAIVINGLQLIENFEGVSFSVMSEINASICKMYVMSLQDVYPIRIVGVYAINAPVYFESIYRLAKLFIKEKIKKRIRVYGSDFKEICQLIHPSILPVEYGGNAASIRVLQAELNDKIESYSDWYKEDAQYGTDETKRPGNPKTAAGLFGTDGSFRKLNVD